MRRSLPNDVIRGNPGRATLTIVDDDCELLCVLPLIQIMYLSAYSHSIELVLSGSYLSLSIS